MPPEESSSGPVVQSECPDVVVSKHDILGTDAIKASSGLVYSL